MKTVFFIQNTFSFLDGKGLDFCLKLWLITRAHTHIHTSLSKQFESLYSRLVKIIVCVLVKEKTKISWLLLLK